jgi:oligopeptide/dipeptide ABC transporter ATP-binding protein
MTEATTEATVQPETVLEVRDLQVRFATDSGTVYAVNGVSLQVRRGETLAIVGESGSGKSVTALAMLGLVPQPPAQIAGGEVRYRGTDLLSAPARNLRRIRGNQIAMVFQDPMTALNPTMTIGAQIGEVIRLHRSVSRNEARRRSLELLQLVGVPEPARRLQQYPHEFSGGMRQRVMIAMAIANDPEVLVADEPTTALDVTIQAQVLELLSKAEQETGAATVLITHDLGIVADMATRVAVMYGGRIVEEARVEDLFGATLHPYTVGLLASLPRLDQGEEDLVAIPGSPRNLTTEPRGCPFVDRCAMSRGRPQCHEEIPPLREMAPGHRTRCHFPDEVPHLVTQLLSNQSDSSPDLHLQSPDGAPA